MDEGANKMMRGRKQASEDRLLCQMLWLVLMVLMVRLIFFCDYARQLPKLFAKRPRKKCFEREEAVIDFFPEMGLNGQRMELHY